MTRVYLSCSSEGHPEVFRRWDWEQRPLAILVAFPYMDWWDRNRMFYRAPCSMMLDSGAFSAHRIGEAIDIDALIAEAQKPVWDEVVSLDVIGDAAGSHRNAEYMLAKGCAKAMPVFHFGDPWEYLDDYAKRWPKVGVGGMVGISTKKLLPWLEQVFARAWPKKLHSFGRCEEDILIRFPFHSADTATWIMGGAFRRWPTRRGAKMTSTHLPTKERESVLNTMRACIEVLWQREQRMTARWGSTLAKLDEVAA